MMTLFPELFLIGVFLGLIGAALFGLSNVVYKSQSPEIHPIVINALKMWITLPVMLLLILVLLYPTGFNVPLESIPFLILSIIIGAGIGDLVYLTSQERIGVSRAFPIAMSFPLITYLLSIAFLLESILITRFIGSVLTVIGVSLITRELAQDDKVLEQLKGELKKKLDKLGIALALFAAIAWASATVILQFGLINADPIGANFIRIFAGSIFVLPIFLIARKRGMPMPTKRAAKFTLLAGFFGMGIGSILYVFAVKYTGAAVASVLGATAPLFALPFSMLFLREKITRLILLGTLLVVFGISFVVIGF